MARTVGGLEDLADAIEAAGGPTPTLVPLSITDEGGLQRLCLAIHERWGRLDLAVHCAAHAAPLAPAAHHRRQGLRPRASRSTSAAPSGWSSCCSRCSSPRPPAASSMSPTTAPASPSSAPTAPARPPPRRWSAPGPPRAARIGPRVARFHPGPMPTALRARFYPGEDTTALTPCAAEADRLLATLRGG